MRKCNSDGVKRCKNATQFGIVKPATTGGVMEQITLILSSPPHGGHDERRRVQTLISDYALGNQTLSTNQDLPP